MRFVATLLAVCAVTPAFAQAKKAADATSVRYFTYLSDFMDGNADVVLKETRSGSTVKSAVLDVCYSRTANSEIKDRFVVDLAVAGNILTGATQSTEGKTPVKVRLTRSVAAGKFNFVGQIELAAKKIEISSKDNSDTSEADFKKNQSETGTVITPAPNDFTELSPDALAIKVKLASAGELLKRLKSENVEIPVYSLTVGCDALRSGEMVISFNLDPTRAGSVIAKLKDTPGFVTAGFVSGSFNMERSVRFAAGPWLTGGKIDRDKMATALSAAIEKGLPAKAESATWSDTTGKLTIKLKRPTTLFPELGLVQNLEVEVLPAFDTPTSSANLMMSIGYPTSKTVDEGAAPRLIINDQSSEGEGGATVDEIGTVEEVAKAFKAQTWDSEDSKWKP